MQSMCANLEGKQCILPYDLVRNELGEPWHMKIVGQLVFFQMPLTLYHLMFKVIIMSILPETSVVLNKRNFERS